MLKLANIFTDNAVLQRNIPFPVWGKTEPNSMVECRIDDRCGKAVSDDAGQFLIRMAPHIAGTDFTLSVTNCATKETLELANIAFGEVWLASGQSNMEFTIREIPEHHAEIQKKLEHFASVRMFTVEKSVRLNGATDVKGKWEAALWHDMQKWSAVSSFFAAKLFQNLDVPVGIVHSSWGGTMAESWISRQTLVQNPAVKSRLDKHEAIAFGKAYNDGLDLENLCKNRDFNDMLAEIVRPILNGIPPNLGLANGWADFDCDDSHWQSVELPNLWRNIDLDFNGVIWFRKEFDLPADWAGKDIEIQLGAIDKQDITYINGVEVGRTGKDLENIYWNVQRVYTIPARVLKPGKNTIAVRNFSFIYNGGLFGPANKMKLVCGGNEISLTGKWRALAELNIGKIQTDTLNFMGWGNPNTFSILFNNMIKPLIPYAMAGVIWYQGESNEGRPGEYEKIMTDLVNDWRYHWGQGDFAFLQVLLANFRSPAIYEKSASWPYLREAQLNAAKATGNLTASAIDVGDAEDIHPHDKRTVGCRLAAAALTQVYNFSGIGDGPTLVKKVMEGSTVRLYFANTGAGLKVKGDQLQGFALADDNNEFVAAEAIIDNDTVIVWSDKVAYPIAVAYAWADNPDKANLYNLEGFPANPFKA